MSNIDEIPIPHLFSVTAYLKLHPSRVFVSSIYPPAINLSHYEETRDDLELIGTTIEKDALAYQFHHRSSVRNCVIIYHFISSLDVH